MDEKQKFMIENYQCPGCVRGYDISCYQPSETLACGKHTAGITGMPYEGRFFLGMPKGFCRIRSNDTKIHIYVDIAERDPTHAWGYDKLNIPVWKYLDEHGNTLVRGMCPRLDFNWIHIYIGNKISDIRCIEITQKDLNEMD